MNLIGPRPTRRYRADGRPAIRLTSVQARHRSSVLERIELGEYRWEAIESCICGGTEGLVLSEKDRFGFPVQAVGCSDCGLVRTTPRLAADCLPAFYEQDYHALHMSIEDPAPATALVRTGQGHEIYSYVAPFISSANLRVAELGTGAGGVLLEFAEAARADGKHVDAFGSEYAGAFVDTARGRGLAVSQGGIEALVVLPPPDVLILSHVLEHLPDPRTDLTAIHRWLAKESLVYVEVPGLLTLHQKPQYDFDLVRYLTLAHMFNFTLASLCEVTAPIGLDLIQGDEEVRALYRVGVPRVARQPDHSLLPRLVRYLRHVDRSPVLAAKRTRLRLSRWSRFRMRRFSVLMLGEARTREIRVRLRRSPR